MITIPQGYRFTTHSWENDADARQTLIKEGLSKRETELLARLASIIKNRGTGLANTYDPTEEEQERAYKVLLPIFEEYIDLFDTGIKELTNIEWFRKDGGYMLNYIQAKLTGEPYSPDFGIRVIESFKIEYIPMDIVLEDVTNQFVTN